MIMKTKGIFIGLCGMDIVFYSALSLPKENTKTKTDCFLRQVGGPAANAAITFSLMGGEAVLYSFVGNDDTGRLLEAKLREYGVRLVRINKSAGGEVMAGKEYAAGRKQGFSTDISSIYVNTSDGSRTIISGQHTKTVQDFKLSDEDAGNADFILYDGNLQGIEPELMKYVNSWKKELVLDAGGFKEKMPLCFSKSTTVIASEGFINPLGEDIFSYSDSLCCCAETRGEKSILYAATDTETGENHIKEIPTVDLEMNEGKKPGVYDGSQENAAVAADNVVDTLAAGDIFHGAYCYYRYVERDEFVNALKRASEVASRSVLYRGTEEFYKLLGRSIF